MALDITEFKSELQRYQDELLAANEPLKVAALEELQRRWQMREIDACAEEITSLQHQQRQLVRELAAVLDHARQFHSTQSWSIKRKILTIDLEISATKSKANALAAANGWLLQGGFVEDTYRFNIYELQPLPRSRNKCLKPGS
jgi:hypothetical protein